MKLMLIKGKPYFIPQKKKGKRQGKPLLIDTSYWPHRILLSKCKSCGAEKWKKFFEGESHEILEFIRNGGKVEAK